MLKRTMSTLLLAAFFANFASAQQNLNLTIYNNNIALVSEKRQLKLGSGTQQVEVTDVAATIIPASVLIQPEKNPEQLKILEQNFEYDLVNANTIFEKYIDQKINVSTEHESTFDGTLLSTSGNKYVFQLDDGQIRIVDPSQVLSTTFPDLPKGLRTKPTLVWQVNNSGSSSQTVDVSYLARQMSWQAEYVGKLSEDNRSLDFTGWVSIDNRAGKTFENAKLKLVAGDVNLVQQARIQKSYGDMTVLAERAAPQFEEKSFFEYHLYTLDRSATLKDKQNKQIQFIPAQKVSVEKEFVYEAYSDGIAVFIKFKNNKKNGLGLPLPQGTVRIYQADTDDAQIFLGEDAIEHTPKDEDVRLKIGKAFDIVAERKELSNTNMGKNRRQQVFEVTLRNHKDEDVKVTVIDRFHGDWSVIKTTIPVSEKTAEKAEWTVPVEKDGEATLTYTIEQRW